LSNPQTVEVVLDSGFDELKFGNENVRQIWLLQKIIYENYGNCLEIRQEENSNEFLFIDDKEFKKLLINYLHKRNKLSVYQQLTHLNFGKHLFIAASMLAIIVLGYFFAVPFAINKSVALLPETFDDKLGNIFVSEFLSKNSQDTAKTLLLNEFAETLTLNNTKPLHFRVVNSPVVNAFALPNGEIIIYSGILKKMNDYTELAGLIGHEVTHINSRHSIKILCKSLAGYIFVSALFSDVNGIVAVLADNAHQLNTLSYSRTFEAEADEQAVYLMMQNNINPCGIVSLFEMLEKEEDSYDYRLLEYVQTHPLTSARIEKIADIISASEFSCKSNPKLEAIFEKMTEK
jgi:Zn-dependent protease with chaperone function